MPLKTSKPPTFQPLWKAASHCSEDALREITAQLAAEIQLGDRLLFEGPMGAGKTTFVRHLLSQLNVVQPPEGSPSFALAHEYHSSRGDIIHIDFYRLKSEMEIEEAGLLAYYWERKAIVISEWLGSWPDLELQVLRSGRAWKISLAFCADTDGENLRDIRIELLN